jgi:hypothetical protein
LLHVIARIIDADMAEEAFFRVSRKPVPLSHLKWSTMPLENVLQSRQCIMDTVFEAG